MKFLRSLSFAVLALAFTTASLHAQATAANRPKMLSSTDKSFLKTSLESMYFENSLAERVRNPKSSASESTQKLGAKIYGDLTKVWGDIATIATKQNEKIPSELSTGDKSAVKRLPKTSDPKFDKEYLALLGKEATKLSTQFETGAKSVQDPELKAAVEKWAPTIKGHAEAVAAAEAEAKAKK